MNHKKTNKKILIPVLLLSVCAVSACNLFGGLSKPSNDEQYLIAARACLDQGDYSCALSNYQALSDSKLDERLSESSLTTLAQNGVFSFSDLIGTLGSSRGSGASFSSMANLLAQRGKTTAAVRQAIQETYVQNEGIRRSELKAFSKFVSSLAMLNSILATVAGADGTLTATDIAADGASCIPSDCLTVPAICVAPASNLNNFSGFPVNLKSNLDTLSDWTGGTTLFMLLSAAKTAQEHINDFLPGSGSGIFSAVDAILTFPGGDAAVASRCARAQLIQTLGLK
jgi:hypothetical protein